MPLPGRKANPGSYRYGFQNQETDPEMLGGAVSFKYRVHDARIGRFLILDPLAPEYPWNSPYTFSENSTIAFSELEGLERYYTADGKNLGKWGESDEIYIVDSDKILDQIFDHHILNSNTTPVPGSQLITKVDWSENLEGLAKIFTTIYEGNFSENNLVNKSLSVLNIVWVRDDFSGQSEPTVGGTYNKPGLANGALMSGGVNNEGEKTMTIHLTKGYLSSSLSNYWNIVSSMVHEKHHIDKDVKKDKNGKLVNIAVDKIPPRHLNAYETQTRHSSWNRTSVNFKNDMISNIKEIIKQSPRTDETNRIVQKIKANINN